METPISSLLLSPLTVQPLGCSPNPSLSPPTMPVSLSPGTLFFLYLIVQYIIIIIYNIIIYNNNHLHQTVSGENAGLSCWTSVTRDQPLWSLPETRGAPQGLHMGSPCRMPRALRLVGTQPNGNCW